MPELVRYLTNPTEKQQPQGTAVWTAAKGDGRANGQVRRWPAQSGGRVEEAREAQQSEAATEDGQVDDGEAVEEMAAVGMSQGIT